MVCVHRINEVHKLLIDFEMVWSNIPKKEIFWIAPIQRSLLKSSVNLLDEKYLLELLKLTSVIITNIEPKNALKPHQIDDESNLKFVFDNIKKIELKVIKYISEINSYKIVLEKQNFSKIVDSRKLFNAEKKKEENNIEIKKSIYFIFRRRS